MLLEDKLKNSGKKNFSSKGLKAELIQVKDYEQVLKVTDEESGLKGIIAIHNTTLGPALGGIRIYPYATFDEALEDVLRLSKGMTYKSAVSETGLGGGKGVILADPAKKTPEMLLAFGAAVQSLGGNYICAEDVGSTPEDMKLIRKATKYVVGLPHAKSSGDPGFFTAWGVYRGIQATCKAAFGTDSVEGKWIAIQGLGNVGWNLAQYLFWRGARLIVADLDQRRVQQAVIQFGAKAVSASEILQVECDILAPCAMGGVINDQTTSQFRCRAIAGGANNQLKKDSHANQLRERGILYAPDFVINAGGLLNVTAEIEEEGYNPCFARNKVHAIYDTLGAIYEIARKNKESTHAAAVALAEYRIKYGIGRRFAPPVFHHAAE